jgi:phenylpropionate dioxygenase-like ring-hydroxylating dioxygenase large terminal subunit
MVAFPEDVENKLREGLPGAWYVVAKSVQVPTDGTFATRALGKNIVLWRGEDGKVRCTNDYCPHRGAPLSRGTVRGNNLSCRYHGVTVDGSGSIVAVPAMPNCALVGRSGVQGYAVEELADAVFVYFPSAEYPEPRPFTPPPELADPAYSKFLCTTVWEANWRYAVENLVDPMHGCYLHADTFTLAYGSKEDVLRLKPISGGFRVERAGQQGVNFDWCEFQMDDAVPRCRLAIPYPPSAGPGGALELLPLVTPIDAQSMRIFFWRMRKVSGLEAEVWRFLFRTKYEPRHWDVLEQDREMISAMPDNARNTELLYQHDIGVGRARQWMTQRAKSLIAAEDAAKAAA